jgi:SAM-dependent methyltransferase
MASASQYDAIAEQYRRSKSSPLRTYVEAWTFLNLVGDVRGKRVLDLACGEGFYSRRLKTLGAKSVVGVDISSAMIDLAEQQERENPQGIDYVCADVGELDDLGRFDIVVAAYLLHYAPNVDALTRMCRNVRRHLPERGRFVTLNENPEQPAGRYVGFEQYGFNKTVEMPRTDGSKITYYMVAGRELFEFHAHYFARGTYERILTDAGFDHVAWHSLALDPVGAAEHGDDYWLEYLSNPPIIGLECRV